MKIKYDPTDKTYSVDGVVFAKSLEAANRVMVLESVCLQIACQMILNARAKAMKEKIPFPKHYTGVPTK